MEKETSFFVIGLCFFTLYLLISFGATLVQNNTNQISQKNKKPSEREREEIVNSKNKILSTKLEKNNDNLIIKNISDCYLNFLTKRAHKGMSGEENTNTNNKTNSKQEEQTSLKKLENIPQKNIPKITIVYATQSNTSRSFAEQIKKESSQTKLKIEIKNISELEVSDFNKNLLIVFLISTYGEGEPTDDAQGFFKDALLAKNNDFFKGLDNKFLNYAIFGLGSSKYEKYCQSSKDMNEFFKQNNVTQLLPISFGDDVGNIKKDFEDFKTELYKNIFEKIINEKYLSKNDVKEFIEKFELGKLNEEIKEFELITSDNPNFSALKNLEGFPVDYKDYEYGIRSFMNSQYCRITEIKEMRQSNKNGSTLKINYNFNKKDHKEIFTYETGDNIGVFPTNNESDVNYIIKRFRFDPELFVHVVKFSQKLKKKISIPSGFSIGELLTNTLDFNGKISKQTLINFIKYVKDQDEYDAFNEIIKDETLNSLFETCNFNLLDLLKITESFTINFLEFYALCSKITPRYYTVASSNKMNKDNLDLVISLVNHNSVNMPQQNKPREPKTNKTTDENHVDVEDQNRLVRFITLLKRHKKEKTVNIIEKLDQMSTKKNNLLNKTTILGLTSNYYAKMTETFAFNKDSCLTRLLTRESLFKLPADPKTPIVMICTGTGIAPFISFLQDLSMAKIKRKTLLLFGSKNSDCDFIYDQEIQSYLKSGVLTHFSSIFSRDNLVFSNFEANDNKFSRKDNFAKMENINTKKDKKYIQDLLEKTSENNSFYENLTNEISEILFKNEGNLYLCGGVGMGGDMMKKLESIFGIANMKQIDNEKRILKELWG